MTRAAALSRAHPREAGLWAGAATLVLVAHVAVVYVGEKFFHDGGAGGGGAPVVGREI